MNRLTRLRLQQWAHTVRTGTTVVDPGPIEPLTTFEEATRRVPSYRTRRTMIAYARARNAMRFKRLQQDYEWLKRMMEEMGMNPEDAKYLL